MKTPSVVGTELLEFVKPMSEVDTHTINVFIQGLQSSNPSSWAQYFTTLGNDWALIVKDQLMLAHLFLGLMPEMYNDLTVALGDKLTPYFRTQAELATFLRCFENRSKWPMVMTALGKTDVLDKLFPDQASIETFIKSNFQSTPTDKSHFLDALRSVKKDPITLFAWGIEPPSTYFAYHETYGTLQVQSSISEMTTLVANCLSDIPAPIPTKFWSNEGWRVPLKEMITQLRNPSKAWDIDPIQNQLKALLLSIPPKETEAAMHILFCIHETEKCKPMVTVHENPTINL